MAKEPAPNETVKASFNLPREELEELRDLAAERNVSVTQALRQAISTERFISEQVDNENKILLESPDQTTREVVFAEPAQRTRRLRMKRR